MLGIHDFEWFVAACILLNLTPGQDTIYIVSRSAAQGRMIGIASALGISAGGLVHTIAAAIGLSAILATSAMAFLIVKLVGAGYLIYLGLTLLLQRGKRNATEGPSRRVNFRTAFTQGILTNVTNPKVALFFMAFLPQFVDPAASAKIPAFLLLGATFLTTGTIWGVLLALLADIARRKLSSENRSSRWLSRACGGLFIGLGLRLAATHP